MHGGARGGEERKRRRHMWPVPTAAPGSPSTPPAPATPLAAADTAVSLLSAPDCFLKDGRKIRVGDCALFQAGDAPPFIGIIRWFATSKEDYLKLCVNWLYRPADVKLAKGILLDAAPNEVFYSFHKDVISAASLLHPCKVAFLRKGIDLPLGKSSFVCRRVYDIENKCLWWLTDQDYINERQEEVDHLLDKTRLEMHAAVQSGGRSPKQLNGSNSTQQLKSASDSVQISGTSFPSQIKGKKRERGDQVTEPIKRERSTKTEDADSGNLRLDGMIKAEIAKMTDKGGLTNSEGVDKLVHIMQLDRAERKLDLAGRVLLADVIAATDRNECLSRFVQLRGVPVLDEWLQEAHKGKNGDGSSPKESDKPVEELLFALLRALDKLPVSLNALQTCNIGKSVNHLRTHKNVEIQKKARSLVDTWKKRVDAEIKNNDAKSIGSSQAVPWPGKPGFSEVSHALNRRPGSADLTIKGPTAQPSTFRALPGKPGHADAIVKSTPGTMGSLKLPSPIPAAAAISSKDPLPKAAGSLTNLELPQTTAREEKSSSSSQSLNNSQSCSSDHAKTVGSSWKEDARSSTAGSMNASKTSSGSSRHRRSNNGFPMTSISGVQKETSLGKSVSLIRTATSDKIPQGALTCERPLDVPVSDHGNSHRLIVRLPNPGRSPVQIAGGVSFEDPSVTGSRASSPSAVDKHENIDRRIRVKGDRSHIATDVNAESWQINDSKEALAGRDRCDPSPVATRDDERRSAAQTEKSTDVSRATCLSSGNEKVDFVIEPKTRNSFSSMNALVESCVKYSEASAAISSGDDIGINLLASVAAGEMSKSNLASTTESPAMEEPCAGSNDAKSGFSCDGGVAQNHCQSGENADVNSEKQRKCAGPVSAKDESLEKGTAFSGDKKIVPLLHESKSAVEHNGENPVSNMNMDKPGDSFLKPDAKLEDERAAKSSVCISAELKEESECDGVIQHQDKLKSSVEVTDSPTNGKLLVKASPSNEKKSADCSDGKIPEGEEIAEGNTQTSDFMCNSLADRCRNDSIASGGKSEKPVVAEPPSCLPSDNEVPIGAALMEQQPTPVAEKEHSVNVDIRDVDAGASSFSDKITCPERSDLMADLKARNLDGSQVIHPVLIDSERNDKSNSALPKSDEPTGHVVTPHTSTDGPEEVVGRKEVPENHLSGSANENSSPMHPGREAERCTKSAGSLLSGDKAETRDELASSAEVSSSVVAALPDTTTKLDFDLNEGFTGDDGHQSEHAPSAVLVSSPAVHLPHLSSFSSSPNSNGCPATITVAAPAKGPFVHPENLSKYKAEPGWKGSAATSAFRPAEPRKVLEMPLSTAEIPSSHPAGKRGRPLLDIDLNVADERVLEDMASPSSAQTTGSESGVISNRHAAVRPSGGLDLDLNIVGEGADNGQLLASTSCRLDQSVLSVRPASGRLPNGDANMFRDFDLNSGPGLDEVGVESLPRSQYTKGNLTVPFLPPVGGLRMNNPEFGSVSSWFPPGGSYPAVAIPSFLSDRGDHPYPIVAPAGAQRILGSVSGAGTFGGDMYRGPVLSSSPAMAFTPTTAFPYAGFPFGSNFPIGSTSFSGVSTTYVDTSSGGGSFFPAIPSQFIGPSGGISAHYPRPYMSSHPEGSASGGSDSSRKWTRQGLDLNAGPGGADTEVKDDRTSSSAPRHLSVAGSQAFLEEQARLYQAAMAGVKRKEPDGGWDAERFVGYKQHSWQ